MSLESTKPTWYNGEVLATESGWVAKETNELLVSLRNLKTRLESEVSKIVEEIVEVKTEFVEEVEEIVEKIKPTKKSKKDAAMETEPKKVIVSEVVEADAELTKKIIGEVVEVDLTKTVIAE